MAGDLDAPVTIANGSGLGICTGHFARGIPTVQYDGSSDLLFCSSWPCIYETYQLLIPKKICSPRLNDNR